MTAQRFLRLTLFLSVLWALLCLEMGNPPQVQLQSAYEDGRPRATLRLAASDYGVVLRHGDGPDQCDLYGARDVWVYEAHGIYYLHYDAAGPTGWLCALATSNDLIRWKKKGPVLTLGNPGEEDAASASYCVTYSDGAPWHLFYLGTPHATPPPERIPAFPYLTMKAKSSSPAGPWQKQKTVTPFRPKPGTYYSATASPGQVIKHQGEFLQFFSASIIEPGDKNQIKRTIGIARTRDLDGPWTIDPTPIVPLDEQIENASLYYEKANQTWFLFTNHVGIKQGIEYTDAVWAYWSEDVQQWNPEQKAVVLDATNCTWSKGVIGLPSVVKVKERLALFYDGLQGDGLGHMKRDIGLAFLDLPLRPPG
ncbi:MAG: hypothetical protein ACRERD_10455 [Candidatus Binatia bacterium]